MTSEKRRAYLRDWHQSNYAGSFEKKIIRLVQIASARAKRKNIDFSITPEDFLPITHCPLLGIPLNFSKRGKGTVDGSPTIDRIDSSQGYVPGNVWVISHKANRMKSDATIEQLQALVINLRKKLKEIQL